VICPEGESAEVAVFVHQDHRGRGLGKVLLNALVEEARRLGLRHVWGTTNWENVPMLRLAHSLGFVTGADPEVFTLDLTVPVSENTALTAA
jgi:phosphinothricin acetyltransferase